uniref:Translation initiation factor n=1 Tax=Solanum tuberosum TaxID=4113 RepID=M1DK24_SOLTU
MAAVPVALPIFHLWPLLPPPKRRRSHKPYPFRSSTLIALLTHCGGTWPVSTRRWFQIVRLRQGGRAERGGFFSDSQSKVDESDNWAANKAFVPSSGRRFDMRGSFESNGSDSDLDRWTKRKEEEGGRRFASGGGAFDSLIERRCGLLGLWGGLWVYGLKEWSNG